MSAMQIFKNADTPGRAVDTKSFVGPATTKLLASADEGESVHIYRVEFEAGGRTNWHTHSGAQWLLIIAGRIRVQRWGQPAVDVAAGDAVVFAPGEKHWHGAVPGASGTHLAVNIKVHTDWLEPVSDQDYSSTGFM